MVRSEDAGGSSHRVDILDRIRKSKAVDDKVVKIVEEIKRANVKVLRNKKWREENGLMLKDGKVYCGGSLWAACRM